MKRFFLASLAAAVAIAGALAAGAAPPPHRPHHNPRHKAHAAAHKASEVIVWVNTKTGVFHLPGERWYGKTKQGKYISESAALAEGDRETQNGQ